MPRNTSISLPFEALGVRSNKGASAEAATPCEAIAHSKVHPTAVQPQKSVFDGHLKRMRRYSRWEEDGCSWEEIHAAKDAIQVRFSTKLKK